MSLWKIRDLRLRDQVLLSYLALLIAPILLTGISIFTWSARVGERQTVTILQQNLRQAELNVSYMLREVSSLAEVVYKNNEVQRILSDTDSSDFRQYEEFLTLDEIIRRIEDTPRVYRAQIFVDDAKLYAREGASVRPISETSGSDTEPGWHHDMTSSRDGVGVHKTLTYVLPIRSFYDVGRTLGLLHISLLEDSIAEILRRTLIEGVAGHALVLTPFGSIADPGTTARDDYEALEASLRDQLTAMPSAASLTLRFGGEAYRMLSSHVEGADWTLVNMVPARVLTLHRQTAGLVTAGAVLLFCVLAAGAAVLVSNRITAGVHDLIGRMESVSEIEWEGAHSSDTQYSKDEIGLLRESFQRMVDRLKELIQENYVANIEKREAELHALQAQINPHFLYNVLESINWMAQAARAPRISEMVSRVGRFYRLGLSGGRDTVTVEEELEYVRTYVEIQQIRFGESVRVGYHVDEPVLTRPIAKLSLQPLVENALIHGILTKPEQCGEIEIHGRLDSDDALVMQVCDDGFEVDFDKVSYILSDSDDRSSQGFGIHNVQERLALFFGTESTLTVSRDGRWTVAEIRIPRPPESFTVGK